METGAEPTRPAWCRRLLGELDANDRRAIALARTLTAHQLNWRRGPAEWSIGQCLEHLHVANEVYLPPIAKALSGRPAGVVEEIAPGWFGRWFIRNYIEPSAVSKRARAPRKITPRAEVDVTILDQFLGSNERMRRGMRDASGYDVNRIRFRNPFVPLIRFSVGTGFTILIRHQQRHLLQAERVRDALAFPAA